MFVEWLLFVMILLFLIFDVVFVVVVRNDLRKPINGNLEQYENTKNLINNKKKRK